jgi:hypothetical protein
MHAYIVLSLLAGIRTEEARAPHWAHPDLDGTPQPARLVPPHIAVWQSVRAHGDIKTEPILPHPRLPRSRARHHAHGPTARPVSASPPGTTAGHRAGLHHLPRRSPRRRRRPQDVQAGLHQGRPGNSWTPRELRTSFVSLMSHRGVSIQESARLVGHVSTRTAEIVCRPELRPVITAGADIQPT